MSRDIVMGIGIGDWRFFIVVCSTCIRERKNIFLDLVIQIIGGGKKVRQKNSAVSARKSGRMITVLGNEIEVREGD